MTQVGLGLRAERGGSVVVGVALEAHEPRILLSTFLLTAAKSDRLAFEPYHVAFEARDRAGRVSADAAAAVAAGRARQDQMAVAGMNSIISRLREDGFAAAVAALLANRAGWITDLLEYSLGAPEHPPVAEGLAVRDALRFAFKQTGIELVELDEKSLPEVASSELSLSAADLDLRLKSLGATAGKPWRKEQKVACLAAWLAVSRL